MFVRQLGDVRKHMLVLMAASYLKCCGLRIVCFAEQIGELRVRGRKATLRRHHGGAEDLLMQQHIHVYRQAISAHAAGQGFACDSVVASQFHKDLKVVCF